MLQALLSERFKLKVHRETKATEVYDLAVGKGGPKLARAEDTTAADPNERPLVLTYGKTGSSASQPVEGFHLAEILHSPMFGFNAVGVTMAKFSDLLKSYVHLPVVDRTRLQGRYNFRFQWDDGPEGRMAPDYLPPSLFTAVERLGLKLERRRLPVDQLVVDHIEKSPVAN